MTFQSGASGNPSGRPKGSGSRQQFFQSLVEPHKEALLRKAIDMALNGNEAMLRMLLERMLPAKPVDEPIQLEMPDVTRLNNIIAMTQLGAVALNAVQVGEMTPAEAARVSALISTHSRSLGLLDLNQRLEALDDKKHKHSQL